MQIDRFIEYIGFEKRFSAHTVKAYQSDLVQFYVYLRKEYQIESVKEVNQHIIRSWVVQLIEDNISSRTVNRKLSSLKSYFKYLKKEGYVELNPMQKVIAPKTSKRLPVFVEKDSMDLLLDEIDFGEGFEAARDRLILDLLYSTGMRLSELISIEISAIDLYNNSIKVLGKRNKERIIPLSPIVINSIRAYLILRKEETTEGDFLFVTTTGKNIYAKLVYRIVNSYLSKVTTLNKKSPHVLRHTFATHMLNKGADLNAIKEILGHSSLSATQVYTHNTIDNLKSIYKTAHPKA